MHEVVTGARKIEAFREGVYPGMNEMKVDEEEKMKMRSRLCLSEAFGIEWMLMVLDEIGAEQRTKEAFRKGLYPGMN